MLGKDLFRTEVNFDISNEDLKSLMLFYAPLIGSGSLIIYEYLSVSFNSTFVELNSLLSYLNISIDTFEKSVDKLNEYKLIRTLKKDDEDKYIFCIRKPLRVDQFIKDDIFVRDFILKVGGNKYQEILSNISFANETHEGYSDVSKRLDLNILNSWSKSDESFLVNKIQNNEYDFGTLFNVNEFLKDVSPFLLPVEFRTYDSLKEIAELADIYDISYDKMRNYIAKTLMKDGSKLDTSYLRYLCMSSIDKYEKVADNKYDVPCVKFLMSMQDGKELSPYDKKFLYTLSNNYNLKAPVINVLIQHALRNCDFRLIESYIFPIASDLHRNNILTAEDALDRLNGYKTKKNDKDVLPQYSDDSNPQVDLKRLEELLKNRGSN